MKKINKLLALLLAAVMVLGMMPTMTVHAHEHNTHAVEVNSVEEYPVLALDTTTTVNINEGGDIAYFTFTPEKTEMYYFYSANTEENPWADTEGFIYDADMNELAYADQAEWGNPVGVSDGNFLITFELEAGKTYILAAKLYGGGATGSFFVTMTIAHNYTSEITKEHTCTEDGVLTWTCSYCGDSYDEPIPAAHIWDEDTGICTVCNETYLIEGVCGDDLTWKLDWFGNLTISGTGDMYDFFYSWEENTPSEWYDNYRYDITSVVIEEGCTSIGDYAFYQCDSMAEASIPASVTEIGSYAFKGTGLTAIEIPDTVATLNAGAFASNYNLESAKLPSGLTAIPASCFQDCGSLSEVVWPTNATTIGAKAFYNCNLGDLVVPEGVTYIGQSAFGGNSDMSKLILPSTLEVLEDYAFSSCWNVFDFVFTGSAPVMPEHAFNYAMANVWYPANNSTWTDEVMLNYGGTLTWKAMCAEHAYGEYTTVEATCTVGEYKTRTCAACGWVDKTEAGEPLGHDYQYQVIEPDCGAWQSGYTIVTCSRCDYYTYDNYVEYEHDWVVTEVEATCTVDGGTYYTCSKCGNYYTENFVAAFGHMVENWSEPTEATCTEASVKTGTCSVCGETATEEVSPALGHTWSEEGTPNDDGSETFTCTVCGDTYRTEGNCLYVGDNDFTVTGSTGTTTKTYTAEKSGKLTMTLNNMVYHYTYAYDQGYTDQWWQTLAAEWVFDSQGWFDLYVNGTVVDYTVVDENELVFATVEVNTGDVLTVEVKHYDSSWYYTEDVMFNLNLALDHEHSWKGLVCEDCGEKRENPFVDVPETSFAIDAILWAVENGITKGVDDTHFNPTGACTRSQVVTFLWRAAGSPEPETTENPFVDVTNPGAFYYKAVLWANENGITTGVDATHFNPDGKCTRGQVVTFLWRAKNKPAPSTTESAFSDVTNPKAFCYEAVLWAAETGITTGMGDGTFGVDNTCDRAQVVTFLYRAYK